MKNDVAVFVAETILYVEEFTKIKSEEKSFYESRTTLQFNKEDLGPHPRKQLNNIRNIIQYYYPYVKMKFKIDKNGNINACVFFNFFDMERVVC